MLACMYCIHTARKYHCLHRNAMVYVFVVPMRQNRERSGIHEFHTSSSLFQCLVHFPIPFGCFDAKFARLHEIRLWNLQFTSISIFFGCSTFMSIYYLIKVSTLSDGAANVSWYVRFFVEFSSPFDLICKYFSQYRTYGASRRVVRGREYRNLYTTLFRVYVLL